VAHDSTTGTGTEAGDRVDYGRREAKAFTGALRAFDVSGRMRGRGRDGGHIGAADRWVVKRVEAGGTERRKDGRTEGWKEGRRDPISFTLGANSGDKAVGVSAGMQTRRRFVCGLNERVGRPCPTTEMLWRCGNARGQRSDVIAHR